MSAVEKIVEDILSPFLMQHHLELYDVDFVKEGAHRYLRVSIDKEGGVSLDDCERVSRFLSNRLDKKDPIKENYYLEVSSPGAERDLKRDEHFEKSIGKKIQVQLSQMLDGKRVYEGKLISFDQNTVTIQVGQQTVEIERGEINNVHLVLEK